MSKCLRLCDLVTLERSDEPILSHNPNHPQPLGSHEVLSPLSAVIKAWCIAVMGETEKHS
jgi:hypothetical protein